MHTRCRQIKKKEKELTFASISFVLQAILGSVNFLDVAESCNLKSLFMNWSSDFD